MKKHFAALFAALLANGTAHAVSMNFTGSFRTEGYYLNKPGLGNAATPQSKAYLQGRALLNPNLVIDDHFSVKSQWSLLASPLFTPGGQAPSGAVVGNGGYIFGDPSTAAFNLNRVWLEWTSDIGVLRLGRMPVDWGYGLLYDGGTRDPWDDWQTTFDRAEYRLHLGHIIGGVSFSKPRKRSTLGDDNDSTFYGAYIQYTNPESDVEGGILYENQWRSPSQSTELKSGSSNPYKTPGTKAPPLSANTPFPLNNHVLDLYVKKTMGYVTLGGELTWTTGRAIDFSGAGGGPINLNAYGGILRATYEQHRVKAFIDFLYASGDSDLSNDLTGFVLLHRNRRPGLILGKELLGPYADNNAGQGSCVMYGNANTFSGCLYLRPGVSFDWTPAISSGLELIIARKSNTAAGEAPNLGVELDLGTTYAVYQNFDLGVNAGVLFPGAGLQQANPETPFAVRFSAAVRF